MPLLIIVTRQRNWEKLMFSQVCVCVCPYMGWVSLVPCPFCLWVPLVAGPFHGVGINGQRDGYVQGKGVCPGKWSGYVHEVLGMSREEVGMSRGGRYIQWWVCPAGWVPSGGSHTYGWQAGGMHPTGMHSCYCVIVIFPFSPPQEPVWSLYASYSTT